MKEYVKQVIKKIGEHKKANPKAQTYTIALPSSCNTSDTTGKAWTDEERAGIVKQVELLKKSVVAAFKRSLKNCYTDIDANGSPILVIQYPMHDIEFNNQE